MRGFPIVLSLLLVTSCKTLSTPSSTATLVLDERELQVPAVSTLDQLLDKTIIDPSDPASVAQMLGVLVWRLREMAKLNPGEMIAVLQFMESLESAAQMWHEQSLLNQLMAAEPTLQQLWMAVSQRERAQLEAELNLGIEALAHGGEMRAKILGLVELPAADRQSFFLEHLTSEFHQIVSSDDQGSLARWRTLLNLTAAIDRLQVHTLVDRSQEVWSLIFELRDVVYRLSRLELLPSTLEGIRLRHRPTAMLRNLELEIPDYEAEVAKTEQKYVLLKSSLARALEQLPATDRPKVDPMTLTVP